MPIDRSRSSTISSYFSSDPPSKWKSAWLWPALSRAVSSSLTALSPRPSQGQCGVVKLRLSSHGSACRFRPRMTWTAFSVMMSV